MSLKPIPQPVLMEIAVELYLRGYEARVLLLCSGLEEEKGCQNNSCVPSMRRRTAKGSFCLRRESLFKHFVIILRHEFYLFYYLTRAKLRNKFRFFAHFLASRSRILPKDTLLVSLITS